MDFLISEGLLKKKNKDANSLYLAVWGIPSAPGHVLKTMNDLNKYLLSKNDLPCPLWGFFSCCHKGWDGIASPVVVSVYKNATYINDSMIAY